MIISHRKSRGLILALDTGHGVEQEKKSTHIADNKNPNIRKSYYPPPIQTLVLVVSHWKTFMVIGDESCQHCNNLLATEGTPRR